jgi:hypothetical protein
MVFSPTTGVVGRTLFIIVDSTHSRNNTFGFFEMSGFAVGDTAGVVSHYGWNFTIRWERPDRGKRGFSAWGRNDDLVIVVSGDGAWEYEDIIKIIRSLEFTIGASE